MIAAALGAAASLSTCAPVPGSERLWDSRAIRFVLVGETHGTREAPELFADLTCAASRNRPVVVALEQPPEEQRAIDTFLESNGGAESQAAFLKSSIWSGKFRDGRSSQAMLTLFGRLRELKQSGRIRGVVAFQDYDLSVPFSHADEGMNRGMARALEHAAATNPRALVLGFGGSTHMSLQDIGNSGIRSAAGRLPRAETVTVFVEGEGGSAWNCSDSECRGGTHPILPSGSICKPKVREVIYPPERPGVTGFDAIACVGGLFTASPPAVPLNDR